MAKYSRMSSILRPIRLKPSGQPVSCWPATIHAATPRRDIEHAERRDERRQPEAYRHKRVDGARQRAGDKTGQQRRDGIQAHHLHAERRRAAGEGENGADGQVDVAAGDDIRETDRQDRQLRVVQQDRERIGQVPPIVGTQRQPDAPEADGEEDRQGVAPGEKSRDPMRGHRRISDCRPRGAGADQRDSAAIGIGWRRAAADGRPNAREESPPDDVGLDQHGSDQQYPDESRHGTGGQRPNGIHLDLLAVDDHDPGDRHSLAQHLVDQDDQKGAQEAAQHPSASAENGGAANDHCGDHDELAQQAGLRGDAFVLRNGHQARQGRAQGGEDVRPDADPCRRNAAVGRCLLVAAGGQRFVAPSGLGQHDGADGDTKDRDGDLVVEPPEVGFAELKEAAERLSLERIEDRASAGQAENNPATDEEHRQRRDERGNAKQGDQHTVDDSDGRADRNGQCDGGTDFQVEPVRVESQGKYDGRQAERRSDRQVQIPVGDDEGHAYRHDRDTRASRGAARATRRRSRRMPD